MVASQFFDSSDRLTSNCLMQVLQARRNEFLAMGAFYLKIKVLTSKKGHHLFYPLLKSSDKQTDDQKQTQAKFLLKNLIFHGVQYTPRFFPEDAAAPLRPNFLRAWNIKLIKFNCYCNCKTVSSHWFALLCYRYKFNLTDV